MPLAATVSSPPAQPADDAPHLLLVDDDRRIRDLLSRFLCGEGYRVTTAASAGDARAKLAGLHFDLLILDVMMPGEIEAGLARHHHVEDQEVKVQAEQFCARIAGRGGGGDAVAFAGEEA